MPVKISLKKFEEYLLERYHVYLTMPQKKCFEGLIKGKLYIMPMRSGKTFLFEMYVEFLEYITKWNASKSDFKYKNHIDKQYKDRLLNLSKTGYTKEIDNKE